MTEPLKSSKGT